MQFIEILKTIVLGIIQGITEWLPISSTGHMILADTFLQLNQPKDFMDMFFVVIQLGSILAVVVLYFNKLNPFAPSKSRAERYSTFQLWAKVLVAVLPVGVIGLLVDDWVTEHFYTPVVIAIALIFYGILFILLERRNRTAKPRIRSFEQLSWRTALCIGFLQLLAIIPGTSRSGSTILGAMLLSCSRFVATEFSFFMAVPVMFGASGYKILKFVLKTGLASMLPVGTPAARLGGLLCGFAVCHQVPDELHPQARLHCLWLVPHCLRCHRPAVFWNLCLKTQSVCTTVQTLFHLLKPENQPQNGIDDRLMQQVDPQTVFPQQGKRFTVLLVERLRQRQPCQKHSCQKQKQVGQERKIIGGEKAAVREAQREQKGGAVQGRRQFD